MIPALLFFPALLLAPHASVQEQQAEPLKCTIEGIVVKAATGEPLKKARVILQKPEGRVQPVVAVTDASGRFLLKDIEPGRYRLSAERDGYVRQDYGQRDFRRPAGIVSLAPGERLRDVAFRLSPGAVITGRVFDDDGEPLPWVQVQVLHQAYVEGRRQLIPGAFATTNDLGEYRVWGLAPGRYTVTATYTMGYGPLGSGGARLSLRQAATEETDSYAPTYYPSTTDSSRASVLELKAGEEVRRIDINLLRVHTVRIRGRVIHAAGDSPDGGTSVFLVSRDLSGRRFAFRNQASAEDEGGKFELRGVLPGSYFVVAQAWDDGQLFATRQPIDVAQADIEGVQLVIARGPDLAGHLTVEGTLSTPLTRLRIWFEPRDDLPLDYPNAPVKADGSFVLKNVSGDYNVGISELPEDFYLKAAHLGTDDVVEAGVSATRAAQGGSLELVISSAGGRVDGVALNPDGQGVAGAAVVLIPESSARPTRRLYKSATTDQYGRFTLRGITPGEYKLYAWEDIEPGAYRDPEFLRPYERRSEPIRVEEAGRYNVELKVIPADSASPRSM